MAGWRSFGIGLAGCLLVGACGPAPTGPVPPVGGPPGSASAVASAGASTAPPQPEPQLWPCADRADVDRDGTEDRIVLSERSFVIETAKRPIAVPLPPATVVRACLGDVTGNGRAELVVGVVRATRTDPTFRQRLFVYSLAEGRPYPLFLGTSGAGELVHLGLLDLDGDGKAEVLARERTDQGERSHVYGWTSFELRQKPELEPKVPAYAFEPRRLAHPSFSGAGAASPSVPLLAPSFVRTAASALPTALQPGLGNVSNARSFAWLSDEARRKLVRDGFVVARPPNHPGQMHSLYVQNQYDAVPSYVTADVALHTLHLVIDDLLQQVESELLGPVLARLVDGMRGQARVLRGTLPPGLEQARQQLLVRLEMAAALLSGRASSSGAEDPQAVDEELSRLRARAGVSARLPGIDYRGFVVRGHYTRSEALGAYFRAQLLLSTAEVRDPREAALLCALALSEPQHRAWLELLDRFGSAFVGAPSSLTPLAVAASARARFGAEPPWAALDSAAPWLVAGKGAGAGAGQGALTLLARRWPIDNELLAQGRVGTELPDPLELLAVLGSAQARARLAAALGSASDALARVDRLAADFRAGTIGDGTSVGGRLLRALRWKLLPYPDGYPAYQRSEAWADHDLVTAGASWAEWRRDTILYVQPPIVWLEGGDEEQLPPGKAGFVEPVPELYAELGAVYEQAGSALRDVGFQPRAPSGHEAGANINELTLKAGASLMRTFEEAARLTLAGQPLSAEQHRQLSSIGAELEMLLAGNGKLELPEVPVIADVYYAKDPEGSQPDQVLLVGTGPLDVLVVAVPLGKRVVLARGVVSSVYQLVGTGPMTDEQWRAELSSGRAPAQPVWARPVVLPRAMPGKKPPPADGERARARD